MNKDDVRMENVKIYLSGGMSNLTLEEQLGWRNRVAGAIVYNRETTKHPIFFNPPNYYSTDTVSHKSEREAMEFDLYNLRNSNVVVVNFNVPQSIGTAMELAIAKEYHIPIIGLNENNNELHPWLTECCTRICDTLVELVDHVTNFYLN